jgi:NADH:ubiquinone oxidoreductase subunit K
VTVGLVHFLFVGAFLFAAGAFLVARGRSSGAALAAVPLLLGGAGLDLAATSRFAASSSDQVGGQEFAIVVAAFTFAFVALGAMLARPETPR